MDKKDLDKKEEFMGRFAPPAKTQPKAPVAAAKKYLAEHKVAAGDTLSSISLKYYNSAVKAKYMVIYEENKAVIGDDPNAIKAGMVLKIPEI